MMKKILYIEDEIFLARVVSDGLRSGGYAVQTVNDGKLALSAFQEFEPDLCVLDIMLPSKDGYAIAKDFKELRPAVPVIFLSAKVMTEDVVRGFRSGGDDYLKKPFSMDELMIRIESLLRRYQHFPVNSNDSGIYRFAGCELDTVRQKLTTSKGIQNLSFKESALLEMMIIRKNDVLERQEALLKIWGDDTYYNTRSMDVFLSHLRKLLKDEQGVEIINLRSVGYKLIC
ncbi:MAG: response regulator transcription factor [Sphingobacteriales bacterium]|nr:MAG: response regulator transcription factor [Sphingobacteriales bacterium]